MDDTHADTARSSLSPDDEHCAPGADLSRHASHPHVGAADVGAIVASPAVAAIAQEATAGAAELPSVVAEYIAAFEAFDIDRIMATHAEDVTFEEVPTGRVLEGLDAVRANLEAFTGALSEFSIEYSKAVASGSMAAAEWTVNARYTGQVEGLPPGERQQLKIRGVDVLDLADGYVQHIREYADYLGFLTQIGVIPGPEETSDATLAT